MSDESMLSDELLNVLKAQAAYRAEQEKVEASLTPLERRLRAKFAEAMKGETIERMAGLNVTMPEHCIVFAQAYASEARKIRAMVPEHTKKQIKAMDPEWVERHAKNRAKLLDLAARNEVASHMCVALYLALRGHEMFVEWFKTHAIQALIPPVPKGWRAHWDSVMAQMVPGFVPAPRVSVLSTPLTQALQQN